MFCNHVISTLQALESFYEKFDPDFIDIRTKAREVLQREDDLNEIVQVYFVYGYSHRILRYLSFQPFLFIMLPSLLCCLFMHGIPSCRLLRLNSICLYTFPGLKFTDNCHAQLCV